MRFFFFFEGGGMRNEDDRRETELKYTGGNFVRKCEGDAGKDRFPVLNLNKRWLVRLISLPFCPPLHGI